MRYLLKQITGDRVCGRYTATNDYTGVIISNIYSFQMFLIFITTGQGDSYLYSLMTTNLPNFRSHTIFANNGSNMNIQYSVNSNNNLIIDMGRGHVDCLFITNHTDTLSEAYDIA